MENLNHTNQDNQNNNYTSGNINTGNPAELNKERNHELNPSDTIRTESPTQPQESPYDTSYSSSSEAASPSMPPVNGTTADAEPKELDPIYTQPSQSSGANYGGFQNNSAPHGHQPYFYQAPAPNMPHNKSYKELKAQRKERKRGGFFKSLAFLLALSLAIYGSFQYGSYQAEQRLNEKLNALERNLEEKIKAGDDSSFSALPPATDKENNGTTQALSLGSSPVVKIAEKVVPAVVTITSTVTATSRNPFFGNQVQTYREHGSGVVYQSDADSLYIITNHHVIENGNSIQVTFASEETVDAEVLGYDSRNDLAVLKVARNDLTDKNITIATFGDSSQLKVGQLAVAIGNPLGKGHDHTITSGIISSVNRKLDIENIKGLDVIQTDAAINPGNSGGALVNEYGQVIGINTAKYLDVKVEGIGFAIPSNIAMSVADKILKNGSGDAAYALSDDRPFLGIGYLDINSDIYNKTGVPFGVYIRTVYKGSAADAAGVKEGDILFSLDGNRIKDSNMLFDAIGKLEVGQTVTLGIVRDDKVFEAETVITSFGEVNAKNNGELNKNKK